MLIGTISPRGPQGPGKLKVFINSVELAAKKITFLIPRKCLRNVVKDEFPTKGETLHLLEGLFNLFSLGLPSLLMVPHRLVLSGC